MKRGREKCSLDIGEGSFVGTYLGARHGQMEQVLCVLKCRPQVKSPYRNKSYRLELKGLFDVGFMRHRAHVWGPKQQDRAGDKTSLQSLIGNVGISTLTRKARFLSKVSGIVGVVATMCKMLAGSRG